MKVVGCCLWGEGDSVLRATWSKAARLTNKFYVFHILRLCYTYMLFLAFFSSLQCYRDQINFSYTRSVKGIVGVVQQHIYSNSKVYTIRDLSTLFDNNITFFFAAIASFLNSSFLLLPLVYFLPFLTDQRFW